MASALVNEITVSRDTLRLLSCNETIDVDNEVATSEAATGFRNYSLANFMKGFGNLHSPVEEVLQTYFHQCAIAMSCVADSSPSTSRIRLRMRNELRSPS